MRILVHDYAGHPFPFELSRELAKRGHDVLHVYCASLRTGPTGSFTSLPDDHPRFRMKGLTLSQPLDKFSFVKRWRQENEYGRLAAAEVKSFNPDVVLSGNTPLDAQKRLWLACERIGAKRIFWVQDVIGLATKRILGRKLPVVGRAIGELYVNLEKKLLRESDAVIGISDDFKPIFQEWQIDSNRTFIIENWAPIRQIAAHDKSNVWSVANDYADKFVFMYTGTMGMKHDPELILALAKQFSDRPEVRVVIASKGLGANWLHERAKSERIGNLDVIGFHPFDELPEALAGADVLMAVLEKEADIYSVPSKVLAYLCAQRCILLAVPGANLAARIVSNSNAGFVVEPSDKTGFLAAAESSYRDAALRATMGRNARMYAETQFDILKITDRFCAVFDATRANAKQELIES